MRLFLIARRKLIRFFERGNLGCIGLKTLSALSIQSLTGGRDTVELRLKGSARELII